MEAVDHISSLPPELLMTIFRRVPTRDLTTLRATHPRLRDAVDATRVRMEIETRGNVIDVTVYRGKDVTKLTVLGYACVSSTMKECIGWTMQTACTEFMVTSNDVIIKVIGRVDTFFLLHIQNILKRASYLVLKCQVIAYSAEVDEIIKTMRRIRPNEQLTTEQFGAAQRSDRGLYGLMQSGFIPEEAPTVGLVVRVPHYYTPRTLMDTMKKDAASAINADLVHMTYEECRDIIQCMMSTSLSRVTFHMPRSGDSDDDDLLFQRLSGDFNLNTTLNRGRRRNFYKQRVLSSGRPFHLDLLIHDRRYVFALVGLSSDAQATT